MELEHRFTVPVGIDKAWPALLDWELVSSCFPGTSLDSVNGNEFAGTATVKVGPLPLTYHGKATVVERDDREHRAVIEATGTSHRGSSHAAMLVTATAIATSPNRTTVDLLTTLSITGRPATFGRPVMVEVGNKLLSKFADAISEKLTGKPAAGFTLVETSNPDEVAAEIEAADLEAELAAEITADLAMADAGTPTADGRPDGTPPGMQTITSTPPVDLLSSLTERIKQHAPKIAGAVAVLLVIRKLRR